MTKTHAIVHSIVRPSSLPIQTNNKIPTSTPSTWMHMIVMAASASAIGATVAVAVYKFPSMELQDNSTISNNKTAYMTRFFNTTDDAILAREDLICGQSRSSLLLIKYPNMILIKNGQNYNLNQIEFKPEISFNKQIPFNETHQTYIIIMLDVDDPIDSPIQYWITTANNHKDICSYKTPNVYTSSHRYAFLLYTTSLKNVQISNNLCIQSNKFPLNKIINDNQLKLLASIYFLSEENLIPSFIDEK